MKNKLFIFVSLLLVAVVAGPVSAKGKKKKATPTPAYHQPVIVNVTGNAITVTDQNGTRTFTVTRFTEINVNGQRATLADLKPGMTATVTIGTDPTHASRINAEGVPGQGKPKK
jgi:hypothetical protein